MKKILSCMLSFVLMLSLLSVFVSAYKSTYSFDFEEMETGFNLMTPWNNGENSFRDTWTPADITSLNNSKVVEEDGNKFGQWNGFIQIPYDVIISEPYVFCVDFKGTSSEKSGFFLRSSGKDFKSSPSDATLGWCGDDGDGEGYTGSTGIFAWPKNDGTSNKIAIGIKTYVGADDTHWVGNLVCEFNAPAGVDLNNFNTWKFADDNVGLVTISVGGSIVCTIEYTSLNTYDGFTENYYTSAVIKDENGKEVGSTDKALICEGSQLAFFTRSATLNMDNLAFEEYVAGGEEVTSDYALIDVTMLSAANKMDYFSNDDGSVEFVFEESNDPYITILISSQLNIKAENYPYFAMYLKTNDYTPGEMFFVTSDCGVGDYSGGYSVPFEYQAVDGNQVVVVDFTDSFDYLGNVIKLRYDAFNGGAEDFENSSVTLYAAGFFKTYEAAYAFAAEGVSVETDAACEQLPEDTTAPAETEPTTEVPGTNAPGTNAPETNAPETNAPETNAPGTKAPSDTEGESSDFFKSPVFFVIIGVAVLAVVIVVIIVIVAKKKK